MRNLFTLLLVVAAISLGPANADMSANDNYNSSDWRVSKAGKLIKKERYKKAITQLRKALKKDADNADAWNLLGFASRKTGELDASAEAYGKALALDPEHKGALEYQGELFITQGNIDQAKANLAKLTELCPKGCDERSKLEQALAQL